MWALSLIARLEGDLPRALTLSEGSVSRHRALGDWFGIVDSLHELGRAALEMGDLDTARSSILEVLETVASFGYRTGAAISLDNLAAEASSSWQPCSGGTAPRGLTGAQGRFGWPASSRVRRPTRSTARCPFPR